MSKINYNNIDEVLRRKAIGRSTLYQEIKQGLFPKPVKIGKRKIAWPQHEVDQMMLLYMRATSLNEVKKHVLDLVNDRSKLGEK